MTGSDPAAAPSLDRKAELRQTVVFLVVGGLGTLVNLLVFLVLHSTGLSSLICATAAFLVALQQNLFLHRRFTFETRIDDRRHHVRYLVLCTATLAANLIVLRGLEEAGVAIGLAQLAGIATATPLNYIGSRNWVFRP